MKKRGQAEHAFAFIIFILVAGFVLLLGYKGISSLIGDSCTTERINFEEKIVGLVERYDDYGSVHKESVTLPCSYTHVCFVDESVYGSDVINIDDFAGSPDKQNVIATARDVKVNIFLVGEFAEPAGYSPKVSVDVDVDNSVLCVEARGRTVNLVFNGQGRVTSVGEG